MKYSDRISFEGWHKTIYQNVLLAMKGSNRQQVEKKFQGKLELIKENWEGYHLLKFANTIRPKKQNKKGRSELDSILESNGIGGFEDFQGLPSSKKTAFTQEKSSGIFKSLAKFQDIPLLVCFLKFLEFCRNSQPPLPLKVFNGEGGLTIEVGNEKIPVTLDYAIDDIKKHIQNEEERLRKEELEYEFSRKGIKQPSPIQPRLTIPQARGKNLNYFANAALDVIGRDEQKARLKAFLKCEKNVAWFQLAGVAGQGKSRLAFDLIKDAQKMGWHAGFFTENDIRFFGDHWRDWQPDKPYLFVFDYVIGREQKIKPILQTLFYRQDKYRHNIRILLVERQRWDQGSEIKTQRQNDQARLELSMHISNKAPWFLRLREVDDPEGERLKPCRFENGVEELKKLDQEDLVTIVKQLSGKELTLSDDALKQTLERIDDTGRPLYAYLLAQQLRESEAGYRSWTKIDLLNSQLERDKNRWEQVFKEENKKAPTWGDSHKAMKLAVLATIIRQVNFEDKKIVRHFGDIDSFLGKEAIAITSSYFINKNNQPQEIYAVEPDLLGEWFVLYCFSQGLKFKKLLKLAWEYAPNETAIFLHKITQDFIDLPKTDNDKSLIEKLLAYPPLQEKYYQVLASVSVAIAYKLYEKGFTIPRNIIVALEHSVNSSNTFALNFLGLFYLHGIGTIKNSKKGVDWFRQAVDLGDSTAMFCLGLCYEKGEGVKQNSGEAIRLYRQAIDLGNNSAMFGLGFYYEKSEGTEQNWDEAIRLYQQAVDLGNSSAMVNLGLCYQTGKGVEQNWGEAIRLYQQAIDLGDSTAMLNLGVCYEKGEGVEQNWDEAIRLYRQAIDLGDSTAMVNLGACYHKGEGIEQNWSEAVRLYQQAVDLGDSSAMANLGVCYEKGEGVGQNWSEAIRLYQQAVDLGESEAMVNLGICYGKGEGVGQNWSEAIRLYQQAVDLGNSTAMINLAFCYARGEGVEQNWDEAIRLYQQAVDLGDSIAMTNLAFCYTRGEGVEQNWDEAIKLYQQAIAAGDERAIDSLQNILLLQNFLGLRKHKSHKTKSWPNNKSFYLATAPVFDPPLITGNWKQLPAKEVTGCLKEVITSFEILGLAESLNGYFGQYVRRLPLNFYEGCNLVDIQLYNPSNKKNLVFSAVFNSDHVLVLTGESRIIDDLNRHMLIFDDKKPAITYLQLFCSYVQTEHGPFQIISNLNEVPFDEGVDQLILDKIKASFFRPQYIAGSFEREGWQQFEACVLYRDTLLASTFKVFQDGNVSMEDDSCILDKIPILQRQYYGIFRTPLRPPNS